MNGMYEELIEKLRKNNRMSGWTHIDRLIDEAAEAIEALQQENNGWRERYDELDAGHSRLFKDFCKLQQENEQLQELAKAKADGRLYTRHDVAVILAEFMGDNCACNFNGIDELLPKYCELLKSCPDVVGVACWEQYLKHRNKAAPKALEQQKANGRAILGS